MERKLNAEINKALERLRSLLDCSNWTVYKKGAYGIAAYNSSTQQTTRTVYALYAEDFVDRVLSEIRFIEASDH